MPSTLTEDRDTSAGLDWLIVRTSEMGEGDGSDKEAKWLIDSLILSAAWKRNLHGWKVELEVLYREKKMLPRSQT